MHVTSRCPAVPRATFSAASIFFFASSASAAVVFSGDVTPVNPASWYSSSTTGYIGKSGKTGSAIVDNGSSLACAIGYLGYDAGSTGTATVTGAGSNWTNSVRLYVGYEGTGTLTVADGGRVNTSTLYASLSSLLGDGIVTAASGAVLDADLVFNGSQGPQQTLPFGTGGTLNVSNWNNRLGVGYKETGTLRIADGVTIVSDFGYLGYISGSTGTATITGTGSTWTNKTRLYVGYSGTGNLNVEAGGQVSSSYGHLASDANCTGTATVTGPGSKWTCGSYLYVGELGNGILNISAGAQVSSRGATLGSGYGSSGTGTITGFGSTWNNSDSLYVGNNGTGTLTVANGGAITATTLFASLHTLLGNGTIAAKGAVLDGDLVFDGTYGSQARVLFGSGGVLTITPDGTGALGAGYRSAATLGIVNGVSVASSYGYLGYNSGSTGTATIAGSGSRWTTNTLYVGYYGTGILNIEAGGQVSSTAANIGSSAGSISWVTITGTGSQLTSSSSIYIGGDGGGALLIEAGGQVSNTSGYVGNNSGSTGTVTVIGTNSNWTNSSTLYVGSAGSGTLTIETGGQVAAKRVTINNKSVVGLHVSGNNMLLLGSTTEAGVVTNSGKTNLYADVFLPAAGYTPISDLQRRSMTWSGTGTYNAFGGTWDSVSKTFVVPAATGVGAGNTATLATGTRTIFTDAAGHRAGVSTGVVTGTPTMVANSMTGGQLDGIGLLPGEAVVAAWDFNTTLTGETLLSFDVGQGLSDLRAWRYSSGAWAPFDTHVVYREGIASFSVTGFSGYAVSAVPEPATWTMLLAAAAALGLYRWRKRRA